MNKGERQVVVSRQPKENRQFKSASRIVFPAVLPTFSQIRSFPDMISSPESMLVDGDLD